MTRQLRKSIREYCRENPGLVKNRYRGLHPLAGHCYHASEAYFHETGGYDKWEVLRLQHEGTTHWCLRDRDSKKIFDLTVEQFSTPPDYETATATRFLTKGVSYATREILKYA